MKLLRVSYLVLVLLLVYGCGSAVPPPPPAPPPPPPPADGTLSAEQCNRPDSGPVVYVDANRPEAVEDIVLSSNTRNIVLELSNGDENMDIVVHEPNPSDPVIEKVKEGKRRVRIKRLKGVACQQIKYDLIVGATRIDPVIIIRD